MNEQEENLYKEKIAAQIQQQRAEIEKLKAGISEKKDDVKTAYQENIQVLENQQLELENLFENLLSSSGDAVQDIKTGFLEAWNNVSDSLKHAKENF